MRAPIRRRNPPLSNTTPDASRNVGERGKLLSSPFFFFLFLFGNETFQRVAATDGRKNFCASVRASSTGGHASNADRPNWGFDGQPSVLLSRRHETHSTGASRNRLRFVRRNLAVAARRRAQASVITAGFAAAEGWISSVAHFRSDAPRSRLPFSRGAERSGDPRHRPTGCLEERPSFDPRSKSVGAVARPRLQPQMTVLFPPNSRSTLLRCPSAKSQNRSRGHCGA